MNQDQIEFGNEWERTVIGHEDIDPKEYARELARYAFASQHIKPGMRVLEIGCSSGFGTRLLPAEIDYLGVDYGPRIIDYAVRHFGSPDRHFMCCTIDEFLSTNEEYFDVIIAFEVLEHVANGREVAQTLKSHCDKLLISTPYREPPGFWGPHHVLHGLKEHDFQQFDYAYMRMDGTIHGKPLLEQPNLLMMMWEKGREYPPRPSVLCCIPTKNRPDSLMQCLQSVAFQTVKPDKVIIYDDGNHQDLRRHPLGQYIFPLLTRHGIDWEVVFMPGRGQHLAHEMANTAGFDLVWRMDDDGVAEPDVLERLLALMAPDVGGAGGAVYELNRRVYDGTSKIEDFFEKGNVQWAPDHGVFDVDFLYSSFLYRAGVAHYKPDMSPVAFHEETIFTHRLKRAGYRLVVDTSIHTHHFKAPYGGCRSQDMDYKWAYDWDNAEFLKIMANEFGIKFIHTNGGLGDCLALKSLMPRFLIKYDLIVIESSYPEVFAGVPKVKHIPYDAAKESPSNNVYAWMTERSWKGTLVDALWEIYQ